MEAANKRILLVGDGNHQFITNYTIWLNKQENFNFKIDILSFTPVHNENAIYYNNIFQIENNTLTQFIDKIKGLRRYYRFYLYKKLIRKLDKYDIIHFHFISVDSYFLVHQFKKYAKSKIILSVWGSDMYQVKARDENGFIKCCQNSNSITFTNKKSMEYFIKKYSWKKDNLSLALFGSVPFEFLKRMNDSKTECKNNLGWNAKKLAITIGYNMASGQQHLEILKQFESATIKSQNNQIQLILPLTYGGDKNYKKQILNKLNQLPYEYTIYDTFLSDLTIAKIRKASDIMIQLQKTDQFSGSMQEHMYIRNVVITGSWLPYDTIKEKGAWFIEIDAINELVELLPNLLNNFERYEQKTVSNPEAITELISWDKNIKAWINLYNKNII